MTTNSVVGRHRKSPWAAIPMDEATATIDMTARLFLSSKKREPVTQLSVGRVIAEQIRASEDVPRTRTSIKDGYAVIASDGDGLRKVVGNSTAGRPYSETVQPGECVRVSTGAIIPPGADAVIQVEDSSLISYANDIEMEVNFTSVPTVGQDIRKPGSDIKNNELLLDIGCEIGSAEIGILHSFGIQDVEVFKNPRVCVISTGNELAESYSSVVPLGYIRDSNRPQLISLFKSQEFDPIDGGIVEDDPPSIQEAIITASRVSSVIVTSGGVSMGEKDHLKEVLGKRLGFKIEFGRVWMKPGLPCTFAHGTIEGRQIAVFALPGNPVSAWVCSHLFVTPFLRSIGGYARTKSTVINVQVGSSLQLGPRPEYCRAWLDFKKGDILPIANVNGSQMSSRLTSLVGAQLLLILPQKTEEKSCIKENEVVEAMVISNI